MMAFRYLTGTGAANPTKTVAFGFLVILAILALRVAAAGTSRVIISKCCTANQQLLRNDKGTDCVEIDGDSYTPQHAGVSEDFHLPPFDPQWLHRWLPPGIPLQEIHQIWLNEISQIENESMFFVNQSAIFNATQHENIHWAQSVVFDGPAIITRNEDNGKQLRTVNYCVDSLKDSDNRYVLLVNSYCPDHPFGITKCCRRGEALAVQGGQASCKRQEKPPGFNSSYHFLYLNVSCPDTSIVAWSASTVEGVQNADFCSRTYQQDGNRLRALLCADSVVDGKLYPHALVYCEWPLVSQESFYSSFRYVSFVTIALLVAALVAVACTARQRKSAHGWALATHAVCLLLFNVGQTIFVLAPQQDIKDSNIVIPLDRKDFCLSLGLSLHLFHGCFGHC